MIDIKTHMFDVKIAEMFGIREAVLLWNFDFWIEKNKANGKHEHDGKYWTYNSIKAYQEMFPYLSKGQVERTINNLIDKGLLEKGNYNVAGYDRTCWYALTDKYYTISHQQETHFSNLGNGFPKNEKPIPYIEPYIETNNNSSIDDFFNECWSKYPKKRGKTQVSAAKRKKIFDVGEEMFTAIERYCAEVKDKEDQYILNGSTFFNGRYEDYLGDDYVPPKKVVDKPVKNTPEPPKYKHFEKEEPYVPDITDEQRRANIERARKIIKGMF